MVRAVLRPGSIMKNDQSPYDQKLDLILAAAARVFAAKGYHNASIRDISRESGVSLSGLYYYFQSKEELLYLIQEHVLATLLKRLQEKTAEVEDPVGRLRILMGTHLRYFLNNMPEMKVLSHESDSLSGDYLERVNAKKRSVTQVATAILEEIRPDSDLDARVTTFGLFGMMNWIYTWYRPERDVCVDTLVDQMSRLFLSGYLNDDGFAMAGTESGMVGADLPLPDA